MIAQLFAALAPFQPTLVGTFPLGLVVDGSDLDIACSGDVHAIASALAPFHAATITDGTLVASWIHDGTPIEVFAQATPVLEQAGFRHMLVEGRLLAVGGSELRERVLAYKRAGMKTEPAFAAALGLVGDPYAALLALEERTHEQLRGLVARASAPLVSIAEHAGDRAELWPLFRIADDSDREIAEYLPRGSVLVARTDVLVGHVQLLPGDPWELKSLAVTPALRGTGLGARLVRAAVMHARSHGAHTIVLSTATADAQLLAFYQRLGFRLTRIDPDIFTEAAGYPPGLAVDGVPIRDRVWLELVP